jgi:hypothetical protein
MLIDPIYALIFTIIMGFFYYIVKPKWAKKSFVVMITVVTLLTFVDSFVLVTRYASY